MTIKNADVAADTEISAEIVQKVLQSYSRLVIQDAILNGTTTTVLGELYMSDEVGGLQIAQQNPDLRDVIQRRVPKAELSDHLQRFVLKKW
jgi:hypothetical protein